MEQLYLTIGQMAELNHVTTQTLRLYDREGLLKPEFQEKSNGYRYYHLNQCAQLDMIQTMKICGMTLRQIRQQLENSSLEELHIFLQEQDRLLEEKMHQLSDSRKSIHRLCENIGQLKSLPPIGELFLEYVPERRIDTLYTEIDYFTDGYAGYERMLRRLKDHMVHHNLPLSYFLNAGTLIEKADFVREYPEVETVRKVPEGLRMAICADDPDKELEYAKKLYQKMQEMEYEADGDYLCEVISQLPMMANDGKRDMIYKIQIPVRRKTGNES